MAYPLSACFNPIKVYKLLETINKKIDRLIEVRCDECGCVIEEAPRKPEYIVCDDCEGEEL